MCKQHRWAWSCIAARSVLFSSADVRLESSADTIGALLASLSKGSGYGGKSCGDGRQNRQTSGMGARLLPSARATPASVELHRCAVSFVFKRGRSAESPADTSGALQASLQESSGREERSCGCGRRVFCRVCEQHRQAWSCIAARLVLFSSADVQLNLPRVRAAHCKQAC